MKGRVVDPRFKGSLVITYDKEVGALYVALRPSGTPIGHTDHHDDNVWTDYDTEGRVIGVEMLSVGNGRDIELVINSKDQEND